MFDKNFLKELQDYVERHLNKPTFDFCYSKAKCVEKVVLKEIQNCEIEDFIKNNRKPTFNQVLFGFIDAKGISDSDVYKKVGIDRRHFSKIRSNPDYKPGKNTVIALAVALEMDKKEMNNLLSSAGYSLSDNDTFDLVIQFCLEKKIFDIHSINQALDFFSLKPLAGVLE